MQPGGHAEPGQRRQVVLAAVDGLDAVEVTAPLGEHREDVVQWQATQDRQGCPLIAELVTIDVPVTARQIAQFCPQVFGEVVAGEGVVRGVVVADILAEVIEIMGPCPARPRPYIPVMDRCRLCRSRRQCQCNPYRFQSYVHRVSSSMLGVIGLPALCYV
ncbi:hypothetical protein D3C84_764200 [compost metagenome]